MEGVIAEGQALVRRCLRRNQPGPYQVQAAINNGPNGPVPYLYAVVLTRGKDGPAHGAAARLRLKGYEVEAGGDKEYGTVVIRQKTSGGGYHTTPDDCSELASLCYRFLASLAGS